MANIKIQFSSVGGAAVEAAFQSIIKGASATSQQIVALSQTLNTTAKGAATFASNIGLSVGEVTRVTNSFNALRSQGLSLSETFKILQRETGINASQYKALVTQLKSAEDQTNAYVKSLKDQEDAQQATSEASAAQILALQQVNQAAQQVSQALKAFTGQAVGAFIEYDGALTTLRAKAQPTTEEMEKLEAAILDVALVTSQTPTSAAKAATSFISVGASASSAAENLKTAAQLTDAFQGDFTVAAKVVQLGANIFKDFGETAQSVGDKLTYISNTTAAGSTNGLDEYLQLFSKSAPLARELGIGLDELVASFGVLRDAGQAPEVAATSLKSLLSTVIDNTDKFKELGIEVFDSNGKFIGLTETFKRIAETQSGVSSGLELAGSELAELSAQSTEAGLSIEQVNDIFGKIGVSSALTLANGYEKVAEKTGLVSEQFGTLSKQAEVVNSSIQGQISLLQGSFESALVDIGKSLSGVTAPAVGGMLQLINVFLAADPVIKNFVGVSLGVATAAAGVVAALTGFALTLKALEVAQVGTTLKVIAATGANTANAVSAVAAGIANQGLARSLGIVAVAAINAAQGVTTAAVAAGKGALAFAPLVIAMGGVVAAGKLVQASVDSSTSANRAKGAIDGLNKALEDYNKVAGVTIPEAEKTKSRFDQLKDGLKELGSELIFRAENFKAFGIGTSAAEAGANSLTIATANMQPALSALNNEFLGFKQAGELGGDTAQALIPALEAAKAAIGSLQAEGAKNINTTAAQTDQWRIEQVALTKMIDELKGAAVATTTLGHANKETTKTYQELVDALANTTGAIETELLNAQAEAYAELGDNKEALEQRLFEIEQDSLEQRLAKQIQFLKDINTATFESDTEKNAKIGEAEEAIASLRLEINKNASDRLIEQEEESLKLREEAEKAFAEKQEALAKQAYDRKKILLDQETNDLNQALDDRIAAENAAIEVLDDRSDLLNQELNLLNLLGDQSALIYAGREQDLNRQIEALGQQNQTIDQQIEKLKQTGASQSEIAALEERKILNANNILVLEEAKRVAAEEQLKVQQAIEQQQLLYQQELTRFDLDRQVRQAQINAIESEREVIQARQLAKSNELELSEQRRLFNLAKINGASEAEIIALQGQIDAATATLALSQESVGLAQQAAQLSKDEVTDAELARAKYEEISQVEAENLRLKQANERAQIANTNEASRTADQLARRSQEADELASSADGAASAIGGAADQGDRLTGSLGQARQEAGLLEQSLVAAGRALSDFQKQQLSEPLRNQTFDSSGKNTTLAKREIGGLGTQYFVGGKEVSESEYNAAASAGNPLGKKKIVLPTSQIGGTAIEGRAVGGDVKRNQPYIVGERGRELFIPNQSGTIVPNSLLTAPTLPGSYSLSPTASTGGADSRALVLEIQGLRRDLANRPVPAVESNVTFVNEPNPLEAQIRLLQGQLRAGRSL